MMFLAFVSMQYVDFQNSLDTVTYKIAFSNVFDAFTICKPLCIY